MRESRDTARDEHTVSRALLGSAVGAAAGLVLLMPSTPLVAFVLMAAILLGVVAVLVRRAEHRRTSGATLERLGSRGYLVLRDRLSPGLTGTIGRLIIGPGGVFVIEVRDHAGRVRVRGDRLVVGRRSHEVGGQLRAQVAAVAATLEPALIGTRVTVLPLICMRRAELPLIGRTVAGIPMLREAQMEHRIATSATKLDTPTIARIADLVERTMPAQSRRGSAPLHVEETTEASEAREDVPELSDHRSELVGASSTLGFAREPGAAAGS